MSIKAMKLAVYESLPIIYDSDGDFDKRFQLQVGDYFLLREPDENKEVGDIVSVYEVIKIKDDDSEESRPVIFRIE